jgi:hypothetical protein
MLPPRTKLLFDLGFSFLPAGPCRIFAPTYMTAAQAIWLRTG